MVTTFPEKIRIRSDDTELELLEVTLNKAKEKFGRYRYLTGYYFAGSILTLGEKEIKKMLKDKTAVEI